VISREQAEAEEHTRLAPRAAFADKSRGREAPIVPDPFRTDFQRDRDRIIHCKAFRRLSHKTQVFLAPEGDHYRTRLTHTLEVSQIARSIARALRLNEDLTEAIALGHDLGHTPFGHTGEDALSDALRGIQGEFPDVAVPYRHNRQSLRIVERLENDGRGLNLTWEVRDGIVGHTGEEMPATLEGQIVRIADRIAYVNHDIDDAMRAGVLAESDLPAGPTAVLGHTHNDRITTMVTDMVRSSSDAVAENSLAKDSVQGIRMSPEVWDAMMGLRAYLFENVYFGSEAKVEEPKARAVVSALFAHYLQQPDAMPPEFRPDTRDELPQRVIDYVSGMTDRFAIRDYTRLFVPKNWMV